MTFLVPNLSQSVVWRLCNHCCSYNCTNLGMPSRTWSTSCRNVHLTTLTKIKTHCCVMPNMHSNSETTLQPLNPTSYHSICTTSMICDTFLHWTLLLCWTLLWHVSLFNIHTQMVHCLVVIDFKNFNRISCMHILYPGQNWHPLSGCCCFIFPLHCI